MQVAQALLGSQFLGLDATAATILDATLAIPRDRCVAVAVSGGADSMALALIAQRWCSTRGITLIAFTVDHGLRPESADEAAQVAKWMNVHGIAHEILTPPAMPAIRNPQAQARARRYGAMIERCQKLGVAHLLLGHHADDQAETLLLQRHRGEASPSRAGMALVGTRENIQLVRPLLGTRKAALVAYLTQRAQPWVEDPSNLNDTYRRNRLRRTLSDAEIVTLWYEAQHSGALRHREEETRNAWMQTHAKCAGSAIVLNATTWRALPDLMRTDLLSHVIRVVGGKPFRPRQHETLRLDAQIAASPRGRATLGLCRMEWNDRTLEVHPEYPAMTRLDASPGASHMVESKLWKLLVAPPFWWFNYPLAP